MNSYSLYFVSIRWTYHGRSQMDVDFPIPSWTGLWHCPKGSDRHVRTDMVPDSEHCFISVRLVNLRTTKKEIILLPGSSPVTSPAVTQRWRNRYTPPDFQKFLTCIGDTNTPSSLPVQPISQHADKSSSTSNTKFHWMRFKQTAQMES